MAGVVCSYFLFGRDDARNEANANVPPYFRKRDLLAAGTAQADGSVVVRADVSIRVRALALVYIVGHAFWSVAMTLNCKYVGALGDSADCIGG